MPTASKTKPGTQKLSDVARHLTVPAGVVSTGWPSVAKTCREKLGVEFDEWQHGAGRVILARRASGKLAATISGVGMSLPRQVGKTYLMAGLLFALCVEKPGMLAIWSAHHSRTHEETFLSMQAFAERGKVKPHVKAVYTGSGTESVVFHNGSRILFGARERGFGRGIPGVDTLVFDEAQILSDRALANMVATMNTSQFGLHLYIGTPPKPGDESESFSRMRDSALASKLTDGGWIECGADEDADPDDRAQWAKANPSYPHRTPVEAFMRLREKLTDEDYLREAMGVWDAKGSSRVIDEESWSAVADQSSMAVEELTLAIDVAPNRSVASVSLAGRRADGLWHVELDEHRKGADWAIGWVQQRAARNQLHAVVIDELSGLSEERKGRNYLKGTTIEVTLAGGRDVVIACAGYFDAVMGSTLRHTDQPQVNVSLSQAGKRLVANGGGWAWNKKNTDSDISPLVSQTLALWGAQNSTVKRPTRRVTGERRAVIL